MPPGGTARVGGGTVTHAVARPAAGRRYLVKTLTPPGPTSSPTMISTTPQSHAPRKIHA